MRARRAERRRVRCFPSATDGAGRSPACSSRAASRFKRPGVRRSAQLPPSLARAPARALRALFAKLQKREAMRTVPWARVPVGQSNPDELRLMALPRIAMPGLLAIEIGYAYGRTPTGYAGAPEI